MPVYRRHRDNPDPEFDPRLFDDQWLGANALVTARAQAGRGSTRFLELEGHPLVLRRYRRGGLPSKLSSQHYLWCGLHRTRPWREFDVLVFLEQQGLPAPRPYACEVIRNGHLYCASLLTYFIAGRTLADQLAKDEVQDSTWLEIGSCIARFHGAGVYHADLNAHNILLDHGVALIDFDRAQLQGTVKKKAVAANLDRLRRSVEKLAVLDKSRIDTAMSKLRTGYLA